MVPEMGERAFRFRLDRMKIPEDLCFTRTMKAGLPVALDHPALLAIVRGLRPVIFLESAIRFSTAKDENSASENSNG